MTSQFDLMQQLADARPDYLDLAPDAQLREAQLRRALTEPDSLMAEQRIEHLTRLGRPVRPVHRRPGVRVAAGLTAAATVAAVAVAATGGLPGSTATPGRRPAVQAGGAGHATGQAAPLQASQILLLAADRVLGDRSSGRYWRDVTELHALSLAGPDNDPYKVSYLDHNEMWSARSASETSWAVQHGFTYAPATAADRQIWKRQGSPAKFTIHVVGQKGDSTLEVSASHKKTVVDPTNTDSNGLYIGGQGYSVRAVRNLPSDQDALTKVLLKNYQPKVATKDQWLFSAATDVLTLPVSSPVRASAYRILAGLNGVRSLGTVTDVDGRTGNGVAIQQTGAQGVSEIRLVINAKTGLLLAQEIRYVKPGAALAWLKPTDVYQATVVTELGWTNDKPPARTKYVPSGHGVG
jgi:hypothetical protein